MSPIISVAPMMDCTDRHDRYFLRLISADVELYSEMITTHALIHGDVDYLLGFDAAEKYVALQLGGSDPKALAHCAKLGEDFGYNEINLNVGCPSPRVSSGRFGACLMLEPELVADGVAAMQARVSIPVTVKCRIGVDEHDSYESLQYFIRLIAATGVKKFVIHARKAWLSGLSPKENREIPPLQYNTVKQVKQDFPELTIIINGGIKNIADIDAQLPHVDGVMIGRAAYSNPYLLAQIQQRYYANLTVATRHEVVQHLMPYVTSQLQNKVRLQSITRHILGLFQGQRGAAAWRRYISENAHKPNAGAEVIEQALTYVT
jgi:tRNA-dihydrouridine synthase A